jgi:hypothetical protein
MKTQLFNKLILFVFLLPINLFGQSKSVKDLDLTGIWKGSLYNDTTQRYLPYELAISEDKGKLTGYSYTLFEGGSKNEWIIKRIKIREKENKLIIEDVALITNTFLEPPPRGVKWMGIVTFSSDDTAMHLQGIWSTSRTREFSPATGSMQVKRALNYRPLTLFKKLEELNLDQTLSFVRGQLPGEDIAKTTPVQIPNKAMTPAIADNTPTANPPVKDEEGMSLPASSKTVAIVNSAATSKARSNAVVQPIKTDRKPPITYVKKSLEEVTAADVAVNNPVKNQKIPMPGTPTAVNEAGIKPVDNKPAVSAPLNGNGQPRSPDKAAETARQIQKTTDTSKRSLAVESPKKMPGKTAPVLSTQTSPQESAVVINPPVKGDPKALKVIIDPTAASKVAERKISNTQEVFFQSDSLILTLYDNGEVDGDTVSVLMNGNMIFAKQGLTTRANSKVIYITPDTPDSLLLVMYAENLGSIPPNTGLLVVRDGEKVYEVRFRADLQSNAGIILRRKRINNL